MKIELRNLKDELVGFLDNVEEDCGVVVMQDTRVNPPTRVFRYHRFNSKSRMPIFIEVAAKWIGSEEIEQDRDMRKLVKKMDWTKP